MCYSDVLWYTLGYRIAKIKEIAPDATIVLAGSKIDLGNRVVTEEEARAYASEQGFLYYDISSESNTNITEMFEGLMDKILESLPPKPKPEVLLEEPQPEPAQLDDTIKPGTDTETKEPGHDHCSC